MDQKRYKSNHNYVVDIVAGNSVLVPVANSVASLDNMMLFNESAAQIVEMLEQGMTIGEVADRLIADYDEAPERNVVMTEVANVASQMVESGYFSEI